MLLLLLLLCCCKEADAQQVNSPTSLDPMEKLITNSKGESVRGKESLAASRSLLRLLLLLLQQVEERPLWGKIKQAVVLRHKK